VAMLVKSSGQDRETLQVFRSGEKPRKFSAHKALAEGQEWHARVREEENEFDALATGQKTAKVQSRAIPAECHLWKALKRARSARQVRRICRQSKHWLKWKSEFVRDGVVRGYAQSPSACPKALYDHAEEFCQAKRDDRYPDSDRPSSDDKRIEFFARVMAGLSLLEPIAPATAVDLLRKFKHRRHCQCWRCTLRRQSGLHESSIR
jgi:hypothetical protein